MIVSLIVIFLDALNCKKRCFNCVCKTKIQNNIEIHDNFYSSGSSVKLNSSIKFCFDHYRIF